LENGKGFRHGLVVSCDVLALVTGGVKPLGVACAELAQWGRPWCSYRTPLGCGERKGHSKKKVTDLDVYLVNFRGTNQPPKNISSLFFLVRFWAFLGKGSSKTPLKYFCKKSMSKTFSEKILRKSTNFSISVFPQLFLLYRVFRCFLAMGVQKHYKKRFTKKSCQKQIQKNRPKKSKTDFFSICFLSRFWAFLGEGSSKTR
jgi:hypothetical protein